MPLTSMLALHPPFEKSGYGPATILIIIIVTPMILPTVDIHYRELLITIEQHPTSGPQ